MTARNHLDQATATVGAERSHDHLEQATHGSNRTPSRRYKGAVR